MSLDAPFLLTALGLVAAALAARHRAMRFGLELRNLHSLMRWIVLGGFVSGHLIDALYYRFDQVAEVVQWHVIWRQPIELLRIWMRWTMSQRPGVS